MEDVPVRVLVVDVRRRLNVPDQKGLRPGQALMPAAVYKKLRLWRRLPGRVGGRLGSLALRCCTAAAKVRPSSSAILARGRRAPAACQRTT
jgi:hypothetical protein